MKTLLDNVMVGLWKYLAVPHHVGISLPDLMLGAYHCLKCHYRVIAALMLKSDIYAQMMMFI